MKIILLLCICYIARVATYKQIRNPFFSDGNNDSLKPDQYIIGGSIKMKPFFSGQREKVEKAMNSSLESATKMKNSVNIYVAGQQKKFSNNINSYMETVRDGGRKVSNTWSYMPIAEPGASYENPDVVLSVPAIIASHGYHCETHTVVSEGYVLNIHRIPHTKTSREISSKTIILQHGLFASSAGWILNGPQKALAYALVDNGYDVWMTNTRGNRYSREHAWLKTTSKSYWNFSWHEVALHDVPAVIDYILKLKGGRTKITYIGHSMGTTILFAMLVLRPEYNDILEAGIALAPIIFLNDIKSPVKSLAPLASNVAYLEMLYGSHEFIPKNSILGKLSTSCVVSNPNSLVCKNFMFYVCGYNEKQFDKNLVPMFLTHFGIGASWKTVVHFSQEVLAGGKFQKFDYGSHDNQKLYGSDTPPEYDLSNVTLPITLFFAQNDLLSDVKDVMMLYETLPKATTDIYMVQDPEFNHLDYLMARDATKLVNEKVVESLEKIMAKDVEERFSSSFRYLQKHL